jgi:hypothetical protein
LCCSWLISNAITTKDVCKDNITRNGGSYMSYSKT